jgi:hypothetical protein
MGFLGGMKATAPMATAPMTRTMTIILITVWTEVLSILCLVPSLQPIIYKYQDYI